ncbi:uncharacterized protein LOC117341350 [Pecten maximus]|uniref:uncharacterized protein LOC117341350 n=1 Tax=Pecten maximus TaxID=6579 RepID=UPI0014582E58|nr:uncharacterized protein LOC117341350 [Pecten maximus]
MNISHESYTNGSRENTREAKSGYDLELVGINDGSFVLMHSLAITCLGLSMLSALCVIVASTQDRGLRGFFSWTKSERFVFYMACTEITLGLTHTFDHSQILITRDHVRPEELCQFFAFVLYTFVCAQLLTVNMIAITVFRIIYLHHNVEYGRNDWKLFLLIFGLPISSAAVYASTGQFGTNGTFCFFDIVNGIISYVIVAILMILILIINTVLYGLTLFRIRKDTKETEKSLGPRIEATHRTQRAARNMFLFLIVYFIQWLPASLLSVAVIFPNPPDFMIHLVVTFSNIGGVLNGIVYYVIRRRRHRDQ